MADKRKTDRTSRSWFRSDRFFLEQGKWYFHTREGTVEGPFDCPLKANSHLDTYIRLHQSGLFEADYGMSLA